MNQCSLIGTVPAAPPIRPTRLEIDLDIVRANAAVLHRVAGTAVFAVVKADAYGHGAVAIGQALDTSQDVAGFAVSLIEEGTQLRDAGISKPILVMGPALDGGYDELVGRDMLAMVTDPSDLEGLAAVGRRLGKRVPVHIKVDTGMGRLGLANDDELGAIVGWSMSRGGLAVTGLATHFACADSDAIDDPDSMTRAQLRSLEVALATVRRVGAEVEVVHAANSAATLRFPESRYDMVRPGIALYGNSAAESDLDGDVGFRQAVKLVTEIVQLREVPAGTAVSYGALWRAPRRSRLAVLPIGYADGYPRSLTGATDVLVAGQRCPVVGAICMDITVVDVTDLGDTVGVGDQVILLGSQNGDSIRVAEFAARAQLLDYEVTCGISKRVPRLYVSE